MFPKLSIDSQGQTFVEFGLVLVVLPLFKFMIIEAGRLFQANVIVHNAVQTTRRHAMTGQFDTACVFESPACLDVPLTSIRGEARRPHTIAPSVHLASIGHL